MAAFSGVEQVASRWLRVGGLHQEAPDAAGGRVHQRRGAVQGTVPVTR